MTEAPDLLHLLREMEQVVKVYPQVLDQQIPAGDVFVQDNGHIVISCADDATDGRRAWVFLDMGSTLSVTTHGWRGHQINPTRARALGRALVAWADRKEAP